MSQSTLGRLAFAAYRFEDVSEVIAGGIIQPAAKALRKSLLFMAIDSYLKELTLMKPSVSASLTTDYNILT